MTLLRSLPLLAAAALLVTATLGCASQREIDRYRNQYRTAQEQILDREQQIQDLNAQIDAMRDAKNPSAAMRDELSQLQMSRAELEAELAKLRDQLARAQANTTPIPVELSDELEALALANPDLMSYDKETGMIRFRSDVTFASGKAEVRDTAIPIIEKLAGVLQSPVASEYEVRVVGHTDNVPMRNAQNLRQYGDNWGLSTARAISVMKQFASAGISEDRMSVAGYGEHQPVVANGEKGAEANRRVEVFLVPQMQVSQVGQQPSNPMDGGGSTPGSAPGSSPGSSSGTSREATDAGETGTNGGSTTVQPMEDGGSPILDDEGNPDGPELYK